MRELKAKTVDRMARKELRQQNAKSEARPWTGPYSCTGLGGIRRQTTIPGQLAGRTKRETETPKTRTKRTVAGAY